MSTLREKIRAAGPIVYLRFGPTRQRAASLAKARQPIPTPVTIPGLIDTGAEGSVLDQIIVDGLNLDYRGEITVHTSTTQPEGEARDRYGALVVLGEGQPDPLTLDVDVIGANYGDREYRALIGRDVLRHCVFTYVGPKGEFTLMFGEADSETVGAKR